jgi:transcriptional regulator with XRE-family HTH domain
MGRKKKINDLELIYLHGLGLTQEQMAQKLDVSRSTVTHALKKLKDEYPDLLRVKDLEEFRRDESDHLAQLRQMMLGALKQKVLKMNLNQISFQQLSLIYGVLFDKDRLLRGEATEHVAHLSQHQLSSEDRALLKDTVRQMTTRALKASSEDAIKKMEDS